MLQLLLFTQKFFYGVLGTHGEWSLQFELFDGKTVAVLFREGEKAVPKF